MSEILDELARSLARPMPRSRALRLLGGAVVSVAVPGLWPTRAAGGTRSRQVATSCSHTCPGHSPFVCSCPAPTAGYCFNTCGVPGSTCCCYPNSAGQNTGAAACPPGTRCGRPGERNCPCVGTPCGGSCCKNDDTCCANSACCKPSEECVQGRTGPISFGSCVPRCPQGRARCGPGKCCPRNWRCANEARGICKRCKATQEECGKKCCNKKTQRCCGGEVCCAKNRACCTVGGKRTCCPANTKCATAILPGDIGATPSSGRICCPPARHVRRENLCCPEGKVALSSPGLRVGPGLEPYCCPNDQLCRSGSSITCCQKSAILGSETCCNGQCVDTRFDAQNCGRCGNVCTSGVCREGICAFS